MVRRARAEEARAQAGASLLQRAAAAGLHRLAVEIEENETWHCRRCRDVGWLRQDLPLGHPDFGKIRRCECQVDPSAPTYLLPKLRQASGMPPTLQQKTFGTFRPRRGTEEALRLALGFARNPGGWLVISGPPGSGKTHLAAAIANQLLVGQLVAVRYWFVPDWLQWVRQGYEERDADRRVDETASAPVLILDDLGVERGTDWERERLEVLIDRRYRNQLPLVVTTNLSAEGVQAISPRIASRLASRDLSHWVVQRCGDYRINPEGGR